MKQIELIISGMSCNHCVMNVKKGLMKMENIKVKDVQVGSAKVEYNEEKVSISDFSGAIKELGFELVTHNAIA